MMVYDENLRKYYLGWYQDCLLSAKYCDDIGRSERAAYYRNRAAQYKAIIEEHQIALK